MREPFRFKREYIPVIFATVILIGLIIALVFVLSSKTESGSNKNVKDENKYIQDDLVIDNKNSKCSSKELDELYKLADKITTKTDMIEKVIDSGENLDEDQVIEVKAHVAQITLSNVSDKLYIHATSDNDDPNNDGPYDEELKPEKGIIKIDGGITGKIVTYTIEVKSAAYSCEGEVIRKFTIITPIFNRFSALVVCNEYPDFKYCQKYIEEDIPDRPTFMDELEKYKKTVNKGKSTTTSSVNGTSTKVDNKEDKKDNKKNNNIYFTIGGIVLLIGVAIVMVFIKKRGSSQL